MLCNKNLFHIFILYSYVLWHASIFTFILSALFHTTLFRINISMCLDFHVGYSVYCFVLCHMLLYLFIFFNLPGALFSIRLLLLIYYIFLFASYIFISTSNCFVYAPLDWFLCVAFAVFVSHFFSSLFPYMFIHLLFYTLLFQMLCHNARTRNLSYTQFLQKVRSTSVLSYSRKKSTYEWIRFLLKHKMYHFWSILGNFWVFLTYWNLFSKIRLSHISYYSVI